MMGYTVIQCLFLRKNAIPFLKEQKNNKKAFTTRSREDAGEKLSVKNYKPIYFFSWTYSCVISFCLVNVAYKNST